MSKRVCAIKLGVAYSTFSENLYRGIIKNPSTSGKQSASERSQRDIDNRKTVMSRACHDADGRTSPADGITAEASRTFD